MTGLYRPVGLLLFALGLLANPSAVAAQDEPAATPTDSLPPSGWVSPTPDAEGTISIVVQPNESLWAIAARAGLTLQELLALNKLDESAIIQPGDVLIVGFGDAVPTPLSPEELTPTPTRPPPTPLPTQRPRQATICLSAFDDANQDGRHGAGEVLRANVAFTVYNENEVVANYITDGQSEPYCLGGLAPGEYHVTRSIAPDEVLTTDGNWVLFLANESILSQGFGSVARMAVAQATQESPSTTEAPPLSTTEATGAVEDTTESAAASSNFPLLGAAVLLAGGLLLLGAVLILLRRKMGQQP